MHMYVYERTNQSSKVNVCLSKLCILVHIIMHIAMEHTSTAYMHTFYNRKMSLIVGAHTCISAYDKDQKLFGHLLFLANSMKFPLIIYSKFVAKLDLARQILVLTRKCLVTGHCRYRNQ